MQRSYDNPRHQSTRFLHLHVDFAKDTIGSFLDLAKEADEFFPKHIKACDVLIETKLKKVKISYEHVPCNYTAADPFDNFYHNRTIVLTGEYGKQFIIEYNGYTGKFRTRNKGLKGNTNLSKVLVCLVYSAYDKPPVFKKPSLFSRFVRMFA